MVIEVLAVGHDKRMAVDLLTYSLLRPGQVYPDSCDVRSGSGNNVGSVVPHVIVEMEGWGVNYRHTYQIYVDTYRHTYYIIYILVMCISITP